MSLHKIIGFRAILVLIAALCLAQPALAAGRVALVIGNSAYKNAAPLSNPVNDASIVEATLRKAGFDLVETHLDLPAADMRRTLRDFADKSRDADVAVVYYAGHGIELEGTNYLIPVDARLERDTDVYDEAFSLDRVLLAIEPARQLRLVILDACRNNPFAENMKRTVGSRSINRGLARIEPASSNTLVAFAAKAGSTASDGNSKNSPYATALVKYIGTPGLDLRRVFGFVRDDVMKATGNKQEPYVYGTLGGDDVPLVPAKDTGAAAAAAAASAAASTSRAEVRHDYELAVQIGNKDALNFFLAQYPDGYYANLAKLQLAKIAAEETRVTATEKARQAEQEQARLVNEGAQQAQLAKAAAELKAAQDARADAERAKETAQQQASQAEQRRLAAESAALAKPMPPPAAQVMPDRPQDTSADTKVAALPDPATSAPPPPSPGELAKQVQTELRRVGCFNGSVSGDWDNASRRSLELFNQNAGTKLDGKTASIDALDAIKQKQARVCPLVCGSGLKRDGDRCVKITCAAGYVLNDDNECERERRKSRPAPTARIERREREAPPPRPKAEANSGEKSQGGSVGVTFMPFFLP